MSSKLVIAALAATAVAFAASGAAQTRLYPNEIAQPDYGSGAQGGFVANTNFNTPESDGRPGLNFYAEGMNAYHRGNPSYALSRLKLAAFWGYAPAAYNLGVMYFQGEGGVPVNRPLGTAWMFIAAERGSDVYASARHMLVSELDNAERAKAYQLYQGLQPRYGEKVAMRRAKNQWQLVKSQQTGTRVGGESGELHVGIQGGGGAFHTPATAGARSGTYVHSWTGLLSSAVDGDVAYQQLHTSTNPYDPVFIRNRTGKATVEPLQQIRSGSDKTPPTGSQPAPSSSSQPAI